MVRLLPGILFYASWGYALTAGQLIPVLGTIAGTWAVGVPAFFGIAILPGYLLDRAAGMRKFLGAHPLETLPRSFAISIGILGLFGLIANLAQGSLGDVLVAVVALGTAVAFLPYGIGTPALDATALENRRARPHLAVTRWPRWTGLVLAALTLLLVVMAAGGENIARDRMWYLAYVTRIPLEPTVTWSEPFFGTPHWPFRFVANAWIFTLAAWKSIATLPGIFFFERVLPVLLTPLVVFAWLGLARSVFVRPERALGGVLGTVSILLATRFPFFSPVDYAFFNRVGEDKFIAYLILFPICLSMLIDYLRTRRRAAVLFPAAFGLALMGLGLSHALVYLTLLICAAGLIAWQMICGGGARPTRLALAGVALGAAAAPAGWFGMKAATRSFMAIDPIRLLREFPDHPVVRSHIRMDRLIDFEPGGPIVNPGLLADPLLLTALLGLGLAYLHRRTLWGGFVLACAVPALVVSFVPFIAPAYGGFVLPWMVYRALWGMPMGFMLAVVFMDGPAFFSRESAHDRTPVMARGAIIALAVTLALVSARNVDWTRLDRDSLVAINTVLPLDQETREMLAAVSSLPSWSLVMTGAAMSEIIPAYTGRRVAAIADRGTTVFVGSWRGAEARMRSQAAVLGLRGGSLGMRSQHGAHVYATHTLWAGEGCDRKGIEVFRNKRYTLCADRMQRSRVAGMKRSRAAAPAQPTGISVAEIGDKLSCTPAARTVSAAGVRTWRRASRWTAQQISVACRASFDPPLQGGSVRIELNLPHSRESLVYRIRSKTADGKHGRVQGAVDFFGNPRAEIALPGEAISKLSLRIAPALLPYLHIKALEVRK